MLRQIICVLLVALLAPPLAAAQCLTENCMQGYITKMLSNNKTIDIYYICYLARINPPPKYLRQVWLLNGGPGGLSGATQTYAMRLFSLDNAGIYCSTDYRGVGQSSELRCSQFTQHGCNAYPDCQDEIAQKYVLSDFYTTQAAQDVIDLVNFVAQIAPKAEVTLYGVSYGTFWLQRIMQLNGNIASKWIFDSVTLQPWFPNGGWLTNNIYSGNTIYNYFYNCTQHPICGKYLTVDDLQLFTDFMTTIADYEKEIISYGFYGCFENAYSMPNNFVDCIEQLTELIVQIKIIGVLSMLNRRDFCDMNPIVYLIVKANELYEYNFMEIADSHNQFPIDLVYRDYYTTDPWVDTVIRNESPIVTNGSVLVMGSNIDAQTNLQNAIDLHNYFISKNVTSKFIQGYNFGHATIGFKSNKQACGLQMIYNFIQNGDPGDTNCLLHSDYATFDTANYSGFTVYTPLFATQVPQGPTNAVDTTRSSIDGAKVAMVTIILVLIVILMGVFIVAIYKSPFYRKRENADANRDVEITTI